MEDNNNQSDQVKKALNEKLERAVAFEELIRVKGWEFVKAYIENQIRAFANKAILEGFKSMDEYQFERGLVTGLRRLIGEIEGDLNTLENERQKAKSASTK